METFQNTKSLIRLEIKMSKDINDVIKDVIKSQKDIYQVDTKLSKEIVSLSKDVSSLKKEMANILSKVDTLIEMITAISLFIEQSYDDEDEADHEDDYESNEGWIPEVNNWEEGYYEDEQEDDE